MANGDQIDYKIGKLEAEVNALNDKISDLADVVKGLTSVTQSQQGLIDKMLGGVALFKWIVGIGGLTSVASIIVAVVSSIK